MLGKDVCVGYAGKENHQTSKNKCINGWKTIKNKIIYVNTLTG